MQCNILEWILGQKKDISGKIGKNLNKVWSLKYHINVNFLILTNVPLL